ncbi:hypothetical protein [Spirosoma rhododendri]|uniref:Uncharacterized protein n=1 Tax=Spirosoma rhododendri TaxID=2728024 RepID=A0A7L5DH59_9BACT|nr:hypothetical protein [Spirosoma rhododendri]QJD77345.1 hypothetical protein HH216_02105 [Spirosoma rhododendri]
MKHSATEIHEDTAKELSDKLLIKNIPQSLLNAVVGTVESYQRVVRALVMLVILLTLAIVLLEYFRRWWKDDFELHFPLGGTAIVLHSSTDSKEFKSAVFIVPASKCWVNTGLEIKNGDRVTIRASGQIHLAMGQIKPERIPLVPWSEPDGSPFVKLDSIDRSDLLIHKHYDQNHQLLIGNLVGYLLPVGESDNDELIPSFKTPHPTKYGGIFHIGSKLDGKLNDTGKTVNLWLSINDIVLEESAKAESAYMGHHDAFINNFISQAKGEDSLDNDELRNVKLAAQKSWINRQKEWPVVKKNKAWDLYYYDSIGHYLVTIEKQ